MRRTLPVVDLAGTPEERGLAHGRAAKAKVAANIRTYLRRFTDGAKIPREEVSRRAEAYRKVIQETNPDYAAAMAGIAKGSGQRLLDVVAVNVRYEMMYSEFAHRGMERAGLVAAGGCTSFALLPERTASGHLLIGQNWDWIPEVEGLVVRETDEDGHSRLTFTEAGIVGGKIGFNGAGLGLAINGLVSNQDSWSHLRRPFHVRCWEILGAKTLGKAEAAVTGATRPCSSNFLIGQSAGGAARAIDLEAAPEGECRLAPQDGFLAHTNHFLQPDALGVWQPLAEDRTSTMIRYAHVQRQLASWGRGGHKVRVRDLETLLGDHTNAPFSVCRHSDMSLPPDDRYETVVSVVMDIDAREMYIAPGAPCTARYRTIRLNARPAGSGH